MFLARLGRKNRIIIVQRNQGLGDNLAATANAWYFAKQTQRELVIVWMPCRYVRDQHANGFPLFFYLPQELDGVPIHIPARLDPLSRFIIAHSDFFNGLVPDLRAFAWLAGYGITRALRLERWSVKVRANIARRSFERREQLAQNIYAGNDLDASRLLVNGCLVPRPEIKPFYDALRLAQLQPRVDAFARAHFEGKKVVGVHVRYRTGDMGQFSFHDAYWDAPAQALELCAAQVHAVCARLAPAATVVFLATNSTRVRDFFAQEFSNLVFVEKLFAADEMQELHDALPVETAEASVMEMFLLARSDILVRYPPESYFSFYASLYVESEGLRLSTPRA